MNEHKWIIACLFGVVVGCVIGYLISAGSQSSSYQAPAYQNVETITWVDWRGRERRIEIHRKAELVLERVGS